MSAFAKTVFGDARNVLVVTLIVAATLGLVDSGHAAAASFVVPPLTLGGIGWLTLRARPRPGPMAGRPAKE